VGALADSLVRDSVYCTCLFERKRPCTFSTDMTVTERCPQIATLWLGWLRSGLYLLWTSPPTRHFL